MRQVFVAHHISVIDVAPALLEPDQVRIEVAYTGICGSELHQLKNPDSYGGDGCLTYRWMPSGQDDPEGDAGFGHEYSGVVREIGAQVDSVAVGDPVVCLPRWPCTRCRQCRAGRLIYCEHFTIPRRGAWADEVVVPARVVFPVPPGVSLREAALCEPLACALRGIDRGRASPGHSALVIGGGPIGLLTAALALRSGAQTVLLSEPHKRRREIAGRLGALPVNPRDEAIGERVDAETGGLGVDVVYEAVGHPETVSEAVGLVARGGTIVVLGVTPPAATAAIRPWLLFDRELTLTGAFGPEAGFQRALALLSLVDSQPVITHVLALDEVQQAVEIAASGDCGKVLLAPRGASSGDATRIS
jgi:(R,R)-butanediol dehydrogenase / meso-butanediol dehydrogenase / diacetyl reductase